MLIIKLVVVVRIVIRSPQETNMRFERNIYIGLFLTVFGIVLLLNGKFFDLSFTIAGPKVIITLIFLIVGILILKNWIVYRRKRKL